MPGVSDKRLPVAAQAFAVGRRAGRALHDDDFALAAHLVEQVARFAMADGVIVGADKGDEAAGQRVRRQHDRDFRRVELLHGLDHGDVVDGNEDHGVGPLLQHLLDHRDLLVDIVRLFGHEVHDLCARRLSDLVGGEAEGLIGRIGGVLGEDGDGGAFGRACMRC